MYGFHKVDDPTGADTKHFEFKNPNFIPGKKELLKRIERRKAVKRSTRKDDDPAGKQSTANHSRRPSASAQQTNNHHVETKPAEPAAGIFSILFLPISPSSNCQSPTTSAYHVDIKSIAPSSLSSLTTLLALTNFLIGNYHKTTKIFLTNFS
jgi:hypothetical protein